jgi:hypothetical protein
MKKLQSIELRFKATRQAHIDSEEGTLLRLKPWSTCDLFRATDASEGQAVIVPRSVALEVKPPEVVVGQ